MERLVRFGVPITMLLVVLVSCGTSESPLDKIHDRSAQVPFNVRFLELEEDASRRRDEPGQHEWWNFFGQDQESGLAISTIFLNGNMFDVRYRSALERYRSDPRAQPPPDPGDFCLLQLNVLAHGRKIFSALIDK